MTVRVDLPEDALARLRAEAERRGVSIDLVIAELAEAHVDLEQFAAQPRQGSPIVSAVGARDTSRRRDRRTSSSPGRAGPRSLGSAGRGVESICPSCNQATSQSTSGLASTPTRSKSTDHDPAGRGTAFDGILIS